MKTLKKFEKSVRQGNSQKTPYYGWFTFQRKSASVPRTFLREKVIRDLIEVGWEGILKEKRHWLVLKILLTATGKGRGYHCEEFV